jgi:uracil-DNA glycosylase
MFTLPQNDWNSFFTSKNEQLQKIENDIINLSTKSDKKCNIYPPKELIFNAFKLCSIENTKVVIIGQDCYHRKNQANGLCFSVNEGIKIPPSLRNIYKEMKSDLEIERNTNDFTNLAKQGVLLLNSSLTVNEGLPGSHSNIWKDLTNDIIKYISTNCNKLVFILWGNHAKKKIKYIDIEKHHIIEGTHPSPMSANRGGFFGGKYFSKTNEYLKSMSKKEIDWAN